MVYKETKTVDSKGKESCSITDTKAEIIDETAPRLGVEFKLYLGNYQTVTFHSSRSGVGDAAHKSKLLQDLVDLKNEFKTRHEDLFA